MGFEDNFYNYLDQHKDKRGWQSELAQKAGLKQSSLSKILRRDTKEPGLKSVAAIIDAIGEDFFNAFPPTAMIKRVGSNAPLEPVESNDRTCFVPVMGACGAGDPIEFFSESPLYHLKIPISYGHNEMAALEVDGDSMAPTIKRGAYVGIIPFDGYIHEGAIYLVDIPPFGRIIKRIHMDENGKAILVSDNPDYGKMLLPDEGYEKIILGKVAWILQEV